MIDDEVKLRVKELCDLGQLVRQYVPTLKSAGADQLKGRCPFHQEKTPSFYVYLESQHYYCYGCQKSGDVFTFIMEQEGLDFMEALRYLGEQVGIDVDRERKNGNPSIDNKRTPRDFGKTDLYRLHEELADLYHNLLFSAEGKHALTYCRERGLSDELIRRFKLGYAPNSFDYVKNWGKSKGFSLEIMLTGGVIKTKNAGDNPAKAYDLWRNRLTFPITNPQGKVIGFSGRVLTPDQKGGKYVNSPDTPVFHKSNVLYGLSQARNGIRDKKYAIICEGQMDTIACHAAGLTNAVAPQGTAFTALQAKLIKRYCDSVVVCFDSDKAGIAASVKSLEPLIDAEINAKIATLEKGDDPDAIVKRDGADALQKFINDAVDAFEFILNLEIENNGATPSGKSLTITNFLAHVAKLNSPVSRSEYCRLASEKVGLPMQPVFDELKELVARERRRKTSVSARSNTASSRSNLDLSLSTESNKAVQDAEGQLLDLCLNHEKFSIELERRLPVDRTSCSIAGNALNELLAYTAQGEWDLCKDALSEKMNEYGCAELIRAINDPIFGTKRDRRDLIACFDGCLKTLLDDFVASDIKNKEIELKACTDQDRKKHLMAELIELDKKKRQFRKH